MDVETAVLTIYNSVSIRPIIEGQVGFAMAAGVEKNTFKGIADGGNGVDRCLFAGVVRSMYSVHF